MFFHQSLEPYVKRPLFLIAIVVPFLFLLFNFGETFHSKEKKQALGIEAQIEIRLPVRLIIPAINVNAAIQNVGVNNKGEMDVPSNIVDVGWFRLGSRPGEKGSAVIAGHFDGKNGEAAVFANLNKLKKGDKVYIKNDKGPLITFTVRESRAYAPGYADDVFSRNDGTYLNLITCDGVWDGVKKSYSKRLVVFADIAH